MHGEPVNSKSSTGLISPLHIDIPTPMHTFDWHDSALPYPCPALIKFWIIYLTEKTHSEYAVCQGTPNIQHSSYSVVFGRITNSLPTIVAPYIKCSGKLRVNRSLPMHWQYTLSVRLELPVWKYYRGAFTVILSSSSSCYYPVWAGDLCAR